VASYVVSELCGLGRDTLRRYEQGSQVPGAEALAALADYYGVTTDWLLGR
jgi:transcriptional regulator with XRE-family HTH domain